MGGRKGDLTKAVIEAIDKDPRNQFPRLSLVFCFARFFCLTNKKVYLCLRA